jgi:8-oxo-dGTP diphosphatase
MEETGLEVELLELFHCYSDPRRDPRQHTVSTVFIGRAAGRPRAGDDATGVAVIEPSASSPAMAFDHGLILADYRTYRASGRRPPPER